MRLNNELALKIRERFHAGAFVHELCKEFDIRTKTVHRVVRGEVYATAGGPICTRKFFRVLTVRCGRCSVYKIETDMAFIKLAKAGRRTGVCKDCQHVDEVFLPRLERAKRLREQIAQKRAQLKAEIAALTAPLVEPLHSQEREEIRSYVTRALWASGTHQRVRNVLGTM